jgi:hypothetical protein
MIAFKARARALIREINVTLAQLKAARRANVAVHRQP